ncbi:hypothetical protein VTO42DRAFT_4841 [Malbranchea cinnamomea]
MGQSASSQRNNTLQQSSAASGTRTAHIPQDRPAGPELPEVSMDHPASETHSLASPNASPMSHSTDMLDAMSYQQDGGPLAETDSRDTSETRASDTSARSRRSTMSRLGSRILPNSVVRGLLNSGEETPAEGEAHRLGLFSRPFVRVERSRVHQRLPSLGGGVGPSRGITRRRSVRGPYPLNRAEAALLPDHPESLHPPSMDRPFRFAWRDSARFSQVRHSIFGRLPRRAGSDPLLSSPTLRPSGSQQGSDDSHRLLAPQANIDTPMRLDELSELDALENEVRPPQPPRPSQPSQSSTLSRILHFAAATIAAQLSGTPPPTGPGLQPAGAEGLEGSLESLLRSLQSITSGQTSEAAEAGSNNENNNGDTSQNVNILRVFRFDNSASASNPPTDRQEGATDQMDVDGRDSSNTNIENNDRRLLTLVVVGVRSMPTNTDNDGIASTVGNTTGGRLTIESFLPFLSPTNFIRAGQSRRADQRSRTSAHRQSVGSTSAPSNQQESQASSRRPSDAGTSELASSLPTTFTESPAGPHPPPSTPADSNLSRVASGASTPSRRPSSASAFLPRLAEDAVHGSEEPAQENQSTFALPHQRRRSDSEAARHRRLGSGAARRNGVVEPDSPSQGTTRSWLIYVIGTNLAENHPAFAAPSLFTDNPTYEDMVLLSSLLGPAKPPVASQEDVASAGGLYRLVEYHGSLVAEPIKEEEGEDTENIPIPEQERCLICLSDYEAGEELRKLVKCKHLYHRECIDEWLLTGRNSCPLCRGEGVSESNRGGERAVGLS